MEVYREKDYIEWQKPLSSAIKIIKYFSKKGDIVLDPFMGSGTFGVAAVLTGRKFIGIEIDEGIFGIAAKRIKEAIKEKSKNKK